MVSGSGTGNIQEVAFGVVNLFKVCIIANLLNSLLQRNHLVVASHYRYRAELQAFRQMHRAYGYRAVLSLHMVINYPKGSFGALNCLPSAL